MEKAENEARSALSGAAVGRKRPLDWPMLLAILLTVIAGMGDWKVLNSALGGIPKVVSLGVPGIALLCFLVRADFQHMIRCLSYLPMFLLYILTLLLWTLAVWTMDFTAVSSIVRGASKLLYQTLAIFYVVGFVYLCRERSVDCFFYSMVLTNGIIAVLEVPGYGLSASIQSVIHCLVTFGDADGYVRQLEIHDITFLFGQFVVYYAALAPRASGAERRANWMKAAIALLFMILGFKRVAIPAAILWAIWAAFIVRRRHPFRWILAMGIGLIAFFWLYLYLIDSGIFARMMHALGVDMMGRDYIWGLAKPYYRLSPTFTGHGFEAVDAIVSNWHHEGLLNHAYPFHNDILKVFVELGFGGFCLWTAVQYLYYPCCWFRKHGRLAGLVYMCLLGYMSATYLTDNTAFYYWSCIGLRLIPMAVSLMDPPPEKEKRWTPSSPEDFAMDVWRLQMEERERD